MYCMFTLRPLKWPQYHRTISGLSEIICADYFCFLIFSPGPTEPRNRTLFRHSQRSAVQRGDGRQPRQGGHGRLAGRPGQHGVGSEPGAVRRPRCRALDPTRHQVLDTDAEHQRHIGEYRVAPLHSSFPPPKGISCAWTALFLARLTAALITSLLDTPR